MRLQTLAAARREIFAARRAAASWKRAACRVLLRGYRNREALSILVVDAVDFVDGCGYRIEKLSERHMAVAIAGSDLFLGGVEDLRDAGGRCVRGSARSRLQAVTLNGPPPRSR